MGLTVQKVGDEAGHHFETEEIFISLWFYIWVELFEDEKLILAYRVYLCWLDQEPNL